MQKIPMCGTIGYEIYGSDFVYALNQLAALDNQITICIDSPGGDFFQALSIYNCIKDLQAKGVEVVAQVDCLAASAASFIAIACSKVNMKSYAMMMVHKAGAFVQSTSSQEMLDTVNGILIDLYANKLNKSPKQIEAMINNDLWMNAEEAVAAGFADSIIEATASQEIMAKVDSISAINNHKNNKYAAVAQLYVHKNNPSVNMLEKVNAALNLDAKASVETVVASISSIVEQSKSVTAKVEKLELVIAEQVKTIEAFEANEKARVEKQANELVNEAVKAGKVSATSKDKWLKFAIADFEDTKALLAEIKNTTVKLHQLISPVVETTDTKPVVKLSPIEEMKKEIQARGNKKYSND